MKTIEKASNKVAAKSATTISINRVEFSATKLWLPLVLGASLLYMSDPAHAGEQQGAGNQPKQTQGGQGQPGKWGRAYGTESQGAGRGTKPAPGYTESERNKGGTTMEQEKNTQPGSESMEKGREEMNRETAPGREEMNRETAPGREEMNRETAPGREEMNRETAPGREEMNRETAPGREEMNRETAPGRESINRDTDSPGGDNMMRDAIPGGSGNDRE